MRIWHVTTYCHAATTGGTERYVLELVQGLEHLGHECTILWLTGAPNPELLLEGDVRILTLPVPPMRVDPPVEGFQRMAEALLDSEKPDLLHFHTVGLTEALLAHMGQERGIPYAFTYHSPAWTCRRETLLLWGRQPCDGEIHPWRCSACQVQERLPLGRATGYLAAAASCAAGWLTLPLRPCSLRRRTAFYHDTVRYRAAVRGFLEECYLVVSCCDWSGPVLRRNGARAEALMHCPQGMPATGPLTAERQSDLPAAGTNGTFTIGYTGRIVAEKGLHILIRGFLQVKEPEVRLRVIGWESANIAGSYARSIKRLAERDRRIELVPRKSFSETLIEYRRLSLLAIPSVCMETGPFTLLEALDAGIPVYGSARIGQLSLVREHGRVVEPNTAENWTRQFTEACWKFKAGSWNEEVSRACRAASRLPRMTDVARDMDSRYNQLASREAKPDASGLPTGTMGLASQKA